ncbi:hypothetical protein OG453_25380 [Streptomyces sp. NBC_01381]|uniref:hypothetical protein n=1 Tax=Streptomyces sp. NBC_01381 TaxID=2903845 RepID=UPI002250F598|nr:hypothetical protein [Streptomyces sp. NBC_01381]MCX4669981.1 hypothetical protein [Streptomyces sp. NBC_01381]
MTAYSTPLDLILGAVAANAFIRGRAEELTRNDYLPEPVAYALTVRRILHGDPLVLAEAGQSWTLRSDTDPDDAPAYRLNVLARLSCPPRVLVTDPDDPTGETDELLAEVLDLYYLATWRPELTAVQSPKES